MYKKIILLLVLFCCGCSSNNPNIVAKFPQDQNLERKQYAGNMFGNKDGIVIFEDKKNAKIDKKENEGLWNKSLHIISSILPISIADENSGLITTDWGNINAISGTNELYKINIIIKNNEFKKENINISVFAKNTNSRDLKIEKKIEELIFD